MPKCSDKKNPFPHCKNNCDCLCTILEDFKCSTVFIRTVSGDFIEGKVDFITKDCCVGIIESKMGSPVQNKKLTIIRCKDIESFSVDLDTKKKD